MLGIFSILTLESTWAAIKYDFVSGIYSIVAYVYDIMIELVESGHGSLGEFQFGDITATVYTLAGVFMLFRITISLLQMLANPDMVNDSQVGGGKLLIRIVMVVVMLMLFFPDGILFDKNDGLFVRTESALLAEDGLINNVVKISGGNHDWSTSKKKTEAPDPIKDTKKIVLNSPLEGYTPNNGFIENVYAAKDPDLTCYYLYVKSHKKESNTRVTHTFYVSSVYKIGFFKGSSGEKKVAGTNYTYTSYTPNVAGKSEYGKYNKLDNQISKGNVFNGGFPSSCPKSFESSSGKWKAVSNYPGNVSDVLKCEGPANNVVNCTNTGFYGYNTYNQMSSAVKSMKRSDTGQSYTVDDSSHKFVRANAAVNGNTAVDHEYLTNLRPESVAFARNALASFQECTADKERCNTLQDGMLTSQQGEQDMRKAVEDEDIKQEFLMSAILGLGLIVYLAFLCVDVVVRKFKLVLLEALAPIPVICYIDPKDKIFNQWIKTYLTIYVDLFIKLLAIRIGIDLMYEVWDDFAISYDHALAKLFYIVGILVFIKAIPDLISSIFGLKLSGSFKDIKSMMGKAAGLGAAAGGAVVGGALGATAGVMSNNGKWYNKMGSGVAGALRGIGSGSKKDVYGGARSIVKSNSYRNDLRDAGETGAFARMFGETKESMGISKYEATKKELEAEHDKIEAAKAQLFARKQEQARQEGAKAGIKKFEDKVESSVLNKNVYDGKVAEVDAFRLAQANVETAKSSAAALIRNAQTATYANDQERLTAIDNARTEGARLISESQSELRSAQKKAFDAAKEYEIARGPAGDGVAQTALESVRTFGYKADSFADVDGTKKQLTKSIGALSDQIRVEENKIAVDEHDLAERERDNENSASKLIYDEMHNRRK